MSRSVRLLVGRLIRQSRANRLTSRIEMSRADLDRKYLFRSERNPDGTACIPPSAQFLCAAVIASPIKPPAKRTTPPRGVDAVTSASRASHPEAKAIMSEERNGLGITHAGFAMTSLPHKRVDEAVWEREGYKTTLLIESGRTRQKMLVKNDDYTGDATQPHSGGTAESAAQRSKSMDCPPFALSQCLRWHGPSLPQP